MNDRLHVIAVTGLLGLAAISILGSITLRLLGKSAPEIIDGGAIVTGVLGYVGGLFVAPPGQKAQS